LLFFVGFLRSVRTSLLTVVVLWGATVSLVAQTNLDSPYSAFGIGDLSNFSSTRQSQMGGVGVALSGFTSVNRLNPASYADLGVVSFDLGAFYEYRSLVTSNARSPRNTGGLYSFTFAFPSRKNFGFVFGLAPYSTMGYLVRRDSSLIAAGDTSKLITQRKGDGGINEYFIGVGGRFLKKKLSFGLNASLLFGQLTERWSSYVDADSSVVSNVTRVTGFKFTLGAMYTDTLKDDTLKNKRYFWRVGGVVDVPAIARGQQLRTIDYLAGVITSPQGFVRDTLSYTGGSPINLPVTYRLGAGFEGRDDKDRTFFVGSFEASISDWRSFRLVNRNDNLGISVAVSAGAEYIPDPASNDWLKRLAIRCGLNFQKTYLRIQGQDIYSFGGSFGFGLPIFREFSRFNIGIEAGTRGTTAKNLIQENYVRAVVGITFNELWFLKRKYD
jgi:hypothetical protein